MNKTANKYLLYGVIILLLLELITLAIGNLAFGRDLFTVSIIAFCFQLVCTVAYWWAWKKVSMYSPKNLPVLYMSASGLRLLFAAFVLLIYMYAHRTSDDLLTFSLVFATYYIICLIYDTLFLVSAEKKQLR
jgi:hypothetical protein